MPAECGEVKRAEVCAEDVNEQEEAEHQRKIIARLENFKFGVETGKKQIDREQSNRERRQQVLDSCLGSLGTDAERKAAVDVYKEREQQVVRAKRKEWSTDDFEAITVIGKGAFGIVHLVRERKAPEKYWALKQMKMSQYSKKNSRRVGAYAEREILSEKANRWFVGLQCTFKDTDSLYMVMEFLQGGDLCWHIEKKKRLSAQETQFYMAELLEALDVVHTFGFIHRDIKSDNVIIAANGHLKLLDFGLVKPDDEKDFPSLEASPGGSTRREQLKSQCGTPQYMAPEVFKSGSSPASDIWAMGILTFECLYGSVPFFGPNAVGADQLAITKQQIERHPHFLAKKLERGRARGWISAVAESFLKQVICERSSRLDLEAARGHPFFQGVEFPKIHLADPPIKPTFQSSGDSSHFDVFDEVKLPKARAAAEHTEQSCNFPYYEFDRDAYELQQPEALQCDLAASPFTIIDGQ